MLTMRPMQIKMIDITNVARADAEDAMGRTERMAHDLEMPSKDYTLADIYPDRRNRSVRPVVDGNFWRGVVAAAIGSVAFYAIIGLAIYAAYHWGKM